MIGESLLLHNLLRPLPDVNFNHDRREDRTYLEKSDIRHDGSYNLDHFGIVIEQISPVLLERNTDYTNSQRMIQGIVLEADLPIASRKEDTQDQTSPTSPLGFPPSSSS